MQLVGDVFLKYINLLTVEDLVTRQRRSVLCANDQPRCLDFGIRTLGDVTGRQVAGRMCSVTIPKTSTS